MSIASHILPDKKIDPGKLEAWTSMNTVVNKVPAPDTAFIYVEDLMMGFAGSRLEPDDLDFEDAR